MSAGERPRRGRFRPHGGLTSLVENPQPIPVLAWHKVTPRWEPGITALHPQRFRRQVEALRQQGARAITLENWLQRGGMQEAGERLVLLCFDDAYACVVQHALPALEAAGFVATLFPVLDFLGKNNTWDGGLLGRRFAHLGAAGIAELLDAGWSLGLHGRTHIHLAGRSLDVLERELVTARSELELQFGRNVHVVAWPFGRWDRRALLVAQAAGLRAGFGRGGGGHVMCMPRHMLYPHHGEAAVAAMLDGRVEDVVQRLAGLGAALSSWLGGSAAASSSKS